MKTWTKLLIFNITLCIIANLINPNLDLQSCFDNNPKWYHSLSCYSFFMHTYQIQRTLDLIFNFAFDQLTIVLVIISFLSNMVVDGFIFFSIQRTLSYILSLFPKKR